MFKDLYAVARHTPLTLIVTPQEGGRLQIIVMPKPNLRELTDESLGAALAKNFSAIGTPDELDAEFPAALARYSAAVNELRTALDLPLDALEQAKKKAEKKDAAKADKEKQKDAQAKTRSEAAKKGAATRATAAAEKKAAERKRVREAALKKRRDAQAARKAAKPASKIKLPGATTEPAPKSATAAKSAKTTEPAAARHLASKPGKAECIADYRAMHARFGDKLTRRGFIKRAATSRRYEKLWKNWEAFVAEAKGAPAGNAVAEQPGKEVLVPPLQNGDDWPFPTDKSIARAQEQVHREQAKEDENSGAAQGQSAERPHHSAEAEPAAPEPAVQRYEIRDDATDELICLADKRPSLGDWIQVPPFVDGKFSRARVIGAGAFGRWFKVVRETSTAGATA